MFRQIKQKVFSIAVSLGLSACGPSAPASDDLGRVVFHDSFEMSGSLKGYVVNNQASLPSIQAKNGRYHGLINNNPENITLHFNQEQGRLDAQLVSFPFNIIVRNIGIGTVQDTQKAPPHSDETYIFAGLQVHHKKMERPVSSHVVVGHRAGHFSTIEGKNTPDGQSFVNDVGVNTAEQGRADLLIQGLSDRTLRVFWQKPNINHSQMKDDWIAYNSRALLPGDAPKFGEEVYVGLITYAYGDQGMPFVGTADSWTIYQPGDQPSK